jgi:hypothetical protein
MMKIGNVVRCKDGREGIIVDIGNGTCKVMFDRKNIESVPTNALEFLKDVDDSDVIEEFAKELVGKRVKITFPDKNHGKKGVIVKVTGWTGGYGATCLIYVPKDNKVYEYACAYLDFTEEDELIEEELI